MDWGWVLLIILGGVVALLATGLPVAFCFLVVNLLGALVFQGGGGAFNQLILSVFTSVTVFTLLPVPMFVLMGEVLWHSGVASRALDVLDKWLGSLPGRLSLLTVLAGTVFSTLSGSTMANTAMLGTMLMPEMERRGYKKPMILGPIIASGGLAMMIPPSALGVLLAVLARISVGKLLIAGIGPGLLMAAFYTAYIVVRCRLRPDLAPVYQVAPSPLSEKLVSSVRYLFPLTFIVFLVIGLMFLGVATPSEAAALGTLGSFILAAAYGGLNWQMVKRSVNGTVNITVMTFMIITGATAFSQLLAYTGATRGLVEFVGTLALPPILLVIGTQIIVLFLGCFMEQVTIMMITLPIFMPMVHALRLDPIWFGVLMLINLQLGQTTPPFGLQLFVMKGVAPKDTTMQDIIRADFPFLMCDMLTLALTMIFPAIGVWLPKLLY